MAEKCPSSRIVTPLQHTHSTASAACMFTMSYKALTTHVCALVHKTLGSGTRKKEVLDLSCVTYLLYVYGPFIKAAWFCFVLIVDEVEESPVTSPRQQEQAFARSAKSGNWHIASL